MAREKLPVVVILLANQAYGIFGTELSRLGLNDRSTQCTRHKEARLSCLSQLWGTLPAADGLCRLLSALSLCARARACVCVCVCVCVRAMDGQSHL